MSDTLSSLTRVGSDDEGNKLTGVPVVPGVAYAPVAWVTERPTPPRDLGPVPAEDRGAAVAQLRAAVDAVAARLDARAHVAIGPSAEVLRSSSELARDKGWVVPAEKAIQRGTHPIDAAAEALAAFIQAFENLGGLFSERMTDLRDIRDRVIAEILGAPEPGLPDLTDDVILFADDLSPADAAGLDPHRVHGVVTASGGSTGHTAIIARQLGIPCVVATRGIDGVGEGTRVLIDGDAGVVVVDPIAADATRRVAADHRRREEVRSWRGPGRTKDGHRVMLLANIQDADGARSAAAGEAEGVGLLRTELCFLARSEEPTVEEQAEIYERIFAAFGPEEDVFVRTLDSGSDKPLKFAHHAIEENPALGVRGLRIGLQYEELLTRQLDALAQAAATVHGEDYTPQVMAPMVSRVSEARRFAQLCRERGISPGVMVEVPATALMAPAFLKEVDFFSIGTNDLTQYTMAADRMSPDLSELTDPWQPSVLRLVRMAATAGAVAGKPVGVCGEASADPLLAAVLVGLGVTSLSMALTALPPVGQVLSELDMARCEQMAEAALLADGARQARQSAADVLAKHL